MNPKLPDLLEVDVSNFDKLISTYITKMGFDIESREDTSDGDTRYITKTTNPMGGKITSIIRAGPFDKNVGREMIEGLYNDMQERRAVRGAFITTSDFTLDAMEYAHDKPISLINRYELIESLRKTGVKIGAEFLELLQKHGLAEERFLGEKHAFEVGMTEEAAIVYFQRRVRRKKFGFFGREDELVSVEKRYAPVEVFKVTREEAVESKGGSYSKVQSEDHVFINLSNMDWYYLKRKRSGSSSVYSMERSDILVLIDSLPDGAKEHLMDLLDHGDLPVEHLEGKDLEILKSKGIVRTYDSKSQFPQSSALGNFAKITVYAAQEIMDLVTIFIQDIFTGGLSDDIKRTLHQSEEEEGDKSVMANVNLPHLTGGIYNLRKFLSVERGMAFTEKEDKVKYSSNVVSSMLSSVLQATVESQGLIFMPYYLGTFNDGDSEGISRRETLISPLFVTEDKPKKVKKVESAGDSFESGVLKGLPYKIIR